MLNKKTDIPTILQRIADQRVACWEAGDFIVIINERAGSFVTSGYTSTFSTAQSDEDELLFGRFDAETKVLSDFINEFGPNGYNALACYVVDEQDDEQEREEAFNVLTQGGLKMNLEIDFGMSTDRLGDSAHFWLIGFEDRNELMSFLITYDSYSVANLIEHFKV